MRTAADDQLAAGAQQCYFNSSRALFPSRRWSIWRSLWAPSRTLATSSSSSFTRRWKS